MSAPRCLPRSVAGLIVTLTCTFTLTGCFGNASAESSNLPKGADAVLSSAIKAMFTWKPADRKSTASAFASAKPYFAPAAAGILTDLADEPPADWATWVAKKATVIPTFTISDVPGGSDSRYTTLSRWVSVTQTVTDGQGNKLGDYMFELHPVELTFANGKWLITKANGLDHAGGGLCPRKPDGSCFIPARDRVATR